MKISDASPGVIIVAIGFMLPARPYFWCSKMNSKEVDKKTNMKVLDWNFTQKHFPWGVLLLLGFINYISPSKSMYSNWLFCLGGGYALAAVAKVSKLSELIGNQLTGLNSLPPFAVMMLACLIISCFTEISANAATAAIFLPILRKLVGIKNTKYSFTYWLIISLFKGW